MFFDGVQKPVNPENAALAPENPTERVTTPTSAAMRATR